VSRTCSTDVGDVGFELLMARSRCGRRFSGRRFRPAIPGRVPISSRTLALVFVPRCTPGEVFLHLSQLGRPSLAPARAWRCPSLRLGSAVPLRGGGRRLPALTAAGGMSSATRPARAPPSPTSRDGANISPAPSPTVHVRGRSSACWRAGHCPAAPAGRSRFWHP